LTMAELSASRTAISFGANAERETWKERRAAAAAAGRVTAEHSARTVGASLLIMKGMLGCVQSLIT